MKTARIGCMVLGIALLMFVIAPYASAQAIFGEWFKGKVSIKGYEVDSDTGAVLSKDSGKGTIYVNIVHGTDVYTVTTCAEDRVTDNVWILGEPSTISETNIYRDSDKLYIWDFVSGKEGMQFPGPAYAYPMFTVNVNTSKTTASFKSFACVAYDDPVGPNLTLGSCSISFKNLDAADVPRGATGCIIIP
jgi:hypothetical protein